MIATANPSALYAILASNMDKDVVKNPGSARNDPFEEQQQQGEQRHSSNTVPSTSSFYLSGVGAVNPRSEHPINTERDEIELLPESFVPSDKDVICGRQRENFHHEGNKYFRELIQENIGAYLGSRSKLEKGEAIIRIAQLINENSNTGGGFVKRDEETGRWFRIKDSEARDKVGHAIRKAVRRLEDTKPKLAAKLRKKHQEKSDQTVGEAMKAPTADENEKKKEACSGDSENQLSTGQPQEVDFLQKSLAKKKRIDAHAAAPSATKQNVAKKTSPAVTSFTRQIQQQRPQYNDPHVDSTQLAAAAASQNEQTASKSPLLLGLPSSAHNNVLSLPSLHESLRLVQQQQAQFPREPASSILPIYDPLLEFRSQQRYRQQQQHQLSHSLAFQDPRENEWALIRAVQRQEEARIRREIDYLSHRLLPLRGGGNTLDFPNSVSLLLGGGRSSLLPSSLEHIHGQMQQQSLATRSASASSLPMVSSQELAAAVAAAINHARLSSTASGTFLNQDHKEENN